MNKKIVWIVIGVVALIIIAAVLGGKNGLFHKGDGEQVASEKAQKRSILETVTASGKIHSETEVKISSEVSGEIIKLLVKEGDSVRKGDLLLEINPVIYESVVSQSQAGVSQVRANRMAAEATAKNNKILYDQAVITYNRQKQLHDEKIISDQDFDMALNNLKNAETALATSQEQLNASRYAVNSSEAQLQQANDNLVKTRIYAPMSGIISLCSVKLGERVVGTAQMAGTELIRIADLDHMQAEVDVSENDVLKVKVGDTASVEVDAYQSKKFLGVVSEIAYSSSTSTATVTTSQAINFSVKVKLIKDSYAHLTEEGHGLKYPFRPGMSATVDIRTNSKDNILTVPIQSVTTREKKDSTHAVTNSSDSDDSDTKDKKKVQEVVFVANNGTAKMVNVTTGIQDATNIEITSGLKEGDMVIKAPFKLISKTLEDGDKIQVVSEKELYKAGGK